ncbi:unnamed protein product [Arabidopsis lyrata]|nr:unnamed protein product [Arabidopsis lyrata]
MPFLRRLRLRLRPPATIEGRWRGLNAGGQPKSESYDLKKFHVGDMIIGRIKRVEPYGLFIDIDQTGMVKKKTIAARRSQVKMIILPEANRKDFDELAENVKEVLDGNKRNVEAIF